MLPLPSPVRSPAASGPALAKSGALAGNLSLSKQAPMCVEVQDFGGHVQSFGERKLWLYEIQQRAEEWRKFLLQQPAIDWVQLIEKKEHCSGGTLEEYE